VPLWHAQTKPDLKENLISKECKRKYEMHLEDMIVEHMLVGWMGFLYGATDQVVGSYAESAHSHSFRLRKLLDSLYI
jgi:hypothetical protein